MYFGNAHWVPKVNAKVVSNDLSSLFLHETCVSSVRCLKSLCRLPSTTHLYMILAVVRINAAICMHHDVYVCMSPCMKVLATADIGQSMHSMGSFGAARRQGE
jgi:hypothetical protein